MIRSSTSRHYDLHAGLNPTTLPQQLAGEYSCIGRMRMEEDTVRHRDCQRGARILHLENWQSVLNDGDQNRNVLASSWSPGPNQHGLVGAIRLNQTACSRPLEQEHPDAKMINQENCELTDNHKLRTKGGTKKSRKYK